MLKKVTCRESKSFSLESTGKPCDQWQQTKIIKITVKFGMFMQSNIFIKSDTWFCDGTLF